MAMVEQTVPGEWTEPARVPPHTYPLWVVLAALLVVLAALYSFTLMPSLVDGGRNLRAGQAAVNSGDYATAIMDLQRAYADSPTSRTVRIYLATAEFGENQSQAALALIQGMKFTQSEWATLTRTMPPSVQALYHQTG